MKARINLFHKDLLPSYAWHSAKYFFRICFGVFFLGVFSYAGSYAYLYHIDRNIQHYDAKLSQLVQTNQELQQRMQPQGQNPEVTQEINQLKRQTQQYQTLIEHINAEDEQDDFRLAPLLYALAKIKTTDLWLTHIKVDLQHIVFKGFVTHPESLPSWIALLKYDLAFQPYLFSQVNMEANPKKKGQIGFTVTLLRTDI